MIIFDRVVNTPLHLIVIDLEGQFKLRVIFFALVNVVQNHTCQYIVFNVNYLLMVIVYIKRNIFSV